MNLRSDPNRWEPNPPDPSDRWAIAKFGIGQPVLRTEDPKLVRGEGRFTDDVGLPGQAHAVMVRSRNAHGVIRSIDVAAARALPGVLGVYTGADLAAAGYGTFKCIVNFNNRDGSAMHKPARPALPTDKVRFVGDPIACVVAETLLQAKDAAEAVEVDIDPLPAVTNPQDAALPGAPLLYDEAPQNIALDYHYGDAARVAEAFAKAAHVTRLKLVNNRVVVNAMEPRAAVARYEDGRFTLCVPSQGVFGMRAAVAQVLGVEPAQVHVITGNIGGSFGMKASVYAEYVCALHAARALGRPVKWTDERSGSFVSDHHGRDHRVTGELALDQDGNFLAVRLTSFGNMGAFLANVGPMPSTLNAVKNVQNVYRTPLIEVSTTCVFTNTSHVSAYRGAGRPEGNYYMERLIDTAAAEMKIDRLELRRRNQIRRRHIPYKAASGMTYDSGDFPAVLRQAVDAADAKGFPRRKRESRKRGKLRGLGIGNFLEVTAPPSKEMGGIIFEPDGGVSIVTGTMDFGMGHASPFAQVLTEKLGIPFDKIRLVQGDSDRLVVGGGSGGSKSIMSSGTAIVEAAAKVIEQGRQIASHVLEASAADIEFKNGTFVIAGTDRAISIMDLADKIRGGLALPEGVPATLDVRHVSEGTAATFPNGCHVAEVEIDPRHRRGRGGQIFQRQRFRHRDQSDDRGRTAPWRRRAGHRPSPHGDDGVRFRRPAPHRLLHGLCAAARRRRARVHGRQPSGAGQDQSARRQGLRRGRLRRCAHLGDERGGGCPVGIRHPAHRHAGDPVPGLAGDQRGRRRTEVNAR